MKRKVVLVLVSLAVLVASVLLLNTLRFTSRQVRVEPVPMVAVDAPAVAGRLAQALRFQTVSHQDPRDLKGEER